MVLNIFLRKVVDICTRRNSWTFNILLVSNQPIKHLKYLKKDVLVDTVPVTFSFKAKTRKRIEKYPTDTDNGPTGDKSTPRLTEPTSSLVSDSMTILRSLFKYAKEIERRPNNRNVNVNNNLYSHRMLHQEKKSCLMTGYLDDSLAARPSNTK
ncbi:unnamed protein product [Rhizophagus irregularis]|uniref:Uncharacterized protein n=1 Tax=Rhizophagus irregularis TaxID=588596 RepID=A0A916EKN6_9GLOM|nr:unnamed protein product [Rhizophagus irregularis]